MIDSKLITFLTLLEEKSYTKTANRLYITQPAVTHHIKTLEKDYGIILFKNQKTFELTKSGQLIYEYAKNMMLQDELLVNNLKKQDSFICNIAFTPMAKDIIPSCEKLHELFPVIPSLNAYCYSYEEIVHGLMTGTLDFAVVDSSFDSAVFESQLLLSEKIVVVGKPDGQYKGKDRITRDQLVVATVILPDENSGLSKIISSTLKTKNIRLKNNFFLYSNDVQLMKNLVLLSDGLAFMYYDAVKDDLEKGILKKYEILNFQATQNLYMIYNRSFTLDEKMEEFLICVSKVGAK